MKPRTAISLYVAVAIHGLLLLALALDPPSQDSAGPGHGLTVRGASLSQAQRRLVGDAAGDHADSARAMPPAPGRRLAMQAGSPELDAQGPALPEVATHVGGGGRDLYFARLRSHLAGFGRPLRPGLEPARSLLRVEITRDGWIEELALASSSGLPELDAEAMDLVRRAAPLPRPPGGRAVRLIVPVEIVGRR